MSAAGSGRVVLPAVGFLALVTGGITATGLLYGTENLLFQLLAVLAFLPLMYGCVLTGTYLTPKSWTVTVHFLAVLGIPIAAFGLPSWWLLVTGQRVPDCLVDGVAEYEDNRGLRYEHDIVCGSAELSYTSRGDPVAEWGQRLDMLVDPQHWLAPLPAGNTPGWMAWCTVAVIGLAVLATGTELTRHAVARTGTGS